MGSFGKSKNKSYTNSSFSPPDWAQPLYKQAIDDLQKLYNQTGGINGSNGKKVADLSDDTRQAINGLLGSAKLYDNFMSNMGQKSNVSNEYLEKLASGEQIGNNSDFKKALDSAMNQTADKINRQFSGAGRYGSGANTQVLSQTLGNMATRAKADQYKQDVANMFRANNELNSERAQKMQQYLAMLSGRSNAYQRALGGAQLLDKNAQDKIDANRQSQMDNWNKLKLFEELLNGATSKFGQRHSESSSTNRHSSFFGKLFGK